jgi:glutathione S-transferase
MSPHRPLKLYHHPISGHAHRARLALSLLGLPHELVHVDLMRGEHKRPEFLALNPFGQIPVLDDDGTLVPDSGAILVYLAERYDADGQWIPRDAVGRARVQAWLSAAAGPIAYGVSAARLIHVVSARFNPDEVIPRAHALLAVVEAELQHRPFLIGDRPSFADVAAYSYIANAPEGNVDLAGYPALRGWLARIEALPGFVPFAQTAVGLRAA